MKLRLQSAYLAVLVAIVGSLAMIGFAPRGWTGGFSTGNGELIFTFDTEAGRLYRLESSRDLEVWHPIRTVEGEGDPMVYSEPVEAGITEKFFRAVSMTAGTELTGDYLVTDAGAILIHPVEHASFVMQWEGLTIYNDPVGGAATYPGVPPADLILIGHRHGDHFSASTIEAIRKDGTRVLAPQDVFDLLSPSLQRLTTVLDNGESAALFGLTVDAVPAYNSNHPRGRDNGYVLTIGGKRIYLSGDTEDVVEMRALQNIEVAFVSMNVPFTMSIDQAASATREFRPKAIYPYHFRNQNGSFADLERFRQLVGVGRGIEVRVRDWY